MSKITKRMWIWIILILVAFVLFGSFVIKLLTNVLMFLILIVLIIIVILGIIWLMKNKMKNI